MKHTIANPDQYLEIETKHKTIDHKVHHQIDPVEQLNIYRFVYSYPFIPMIDLTLAFDELSKMIQSWFLKKTKNTNLYKSKIHENL